jgi:Ca-activated chloride channel family protein
VRLLIITLLFLVTPGVSRADGFIIPRPPPHLIEVVPDLTVKYHHVQVAIEDQVAQTHIDQVFLNESPYEFEGTYIFPLPEKAAISEFAMFVDGERLSGKMLDREEARRIYEGIVRRRRDPALLEYVGRNAFQASIYPIPAHSEKRVQLAYSEVLVAEEGLVHYVYPLSTERFSARPLEEVAITIDLHSQVPIKAIYSPSHKIAIERTSKTSALISFEANDVRPDTDFELYYSISEEDVGLNLVSYRERGEDGFFLLLIAPDMDVDQRAVVAKDVIFVLDTSGSMEGKKLRQAQEAIEFVLDHLHEEDRFNIVAFDTGVTAYAPGLRPAYERREARRFVRRLSAGGGTNIHRALLEAIAIAKGERPQFIIFLTDGLPTAGVTSLEEIIADVDRAATDDMRLFTFGVGYDVNTILLDTISQEHRGASAYVEPGQSIEEEVAAFYTKISSPLLSHVRLRVDGVLVEDTYPYPLPDLFAGSQLLVVGRYRRAGRARVTLEGMVNDRRRIFSYPAVQLASYGGQESLPRLWATRKIGHLLKEIRLHGENRELVDEIVSLSVRYGIMTPYTSFLVDERQDILTDAGRQRIAASSELAAPMAMPSSGAKAVADSQAQSSLAESERGGGVETTGVKVVANKAFVLRDEVWTDTVYDPQHMQAIQVPFGTPAYFKLLADHPEWGKYFAIGDRVIVVMDGVAYQVGPGDATSATTPSSPAQMPSLWDRFRFWLRTLPR